MLSAIFIAISMLSVRKVGAKTHILMPGLSWALANTLLSGFFIFGPQKTSMTTTYTSYELFHLSIICLGNALFQLLITLAYIKEKAARVAPLGATQLIINCAVDIFIINRDRPVLVSQVIGSAIIVTSNIAIGVLKCYNVII